MNFRSYFWALVSRVYSKLGPLSCCGRIRIVGYPVVRGAGAIRIGAGCDLRSKSWSTAMGVPQSCVLNVLTPASVIEIGEGCGISGAVICAKERVSIGDRVQVGSGAIICDTDFHSMDHGLRGTSEDLADAKSAPVSIADDCFIGARAMVLKGVSIGARSIVGAGTVVVKDVPEDSVVVGNPARVIRSLV